MTTLWMILALVLALGAGLTVVLRRMLRSATAEPNSVTLDEILAPRRGVRETYGPMTRLFAEGDFIWVTAQARRPGLAQQLRHQRIRVMRLYLRQLRVDFGRIYGLARQLAPGSLDPDFASRITIHAFRFHALWMAVQVRCALGWFAPVRVETTGLVTALDRLREAARVCLVAARPLGQTA